MISKNKKLIRYRYRSKGSVLAFAAMCVLILTVLGLGLLAVAYGSRVQAIQVKTETMALLTAEAGYEEAIVLMGRQNDLLSSLAAGGLSGTIEELENSSCDYNIMFHNFAEAQPVYRIIATGRCGRAGRTVDVLVKQAVGRWEMGSCRVPFTPWTTRPIFFNTSDIVAMPLHINCQGSPDGLLKDIYISGRPRFMKPVSMGESRYDRRERDKYESIINLFEGGIYFNQPDVDKSTEPESLAAKTDRFRATTKTAYRFSPLKSDAVDNGAAAVQLEFYVDNNGKGMVSIRDHCTVKLAAPGRWDYKIGTDTPYEQYGLYAYHYVSRMDRPVQARISDTYVKQTFGRDKSAPGGQIYIDGNVIIGGELPSQLQGKLTVVATGNIWIANSVVYSDDGTSRDATGLPSPDNPNVLGLISRDGVIKVIDPGLSAADGGPPDLSSARLQYQPVGLQDPISTESYDRILPAPMEVEAAMTIGGGGWGAENVESRKGQATNLIVRGSISEAITAVVGSAFSRHYFLDERLQDGILPGDIWLQSKYVPAPGGWTDYRATAD